MHPNLSIIVGAAILRVKDALLGSVATEIVRLPTRIDVPQQKQSRRLLGLYCKENDKDILFTNKQKIKVEETFNN